MDMPFKTVRAMIATTMCLFLKMVDSFLDDF